MNREILKKYDNSFYKIMAENFGDEIFVTDGVGTVLFVNPAAVKVVGKPLDELIGRYVGDLESEGYFKPSVTLQVLKKKKTVHLLQTVKDGKIVLVTGVPIFDNLQENITMVISTTKDFEAINELIETIEEQKAVISNLQDITFDEIGFVGGDKNSESKKTIKKVASLDMPILIHGETGVGKEVAAKTIHALGLGKDRPFIKINCGTIPENLIESELFGYEKGAFTGAEKDGKKGKVELAENGTLFLDEIGELPLSMQVKLLDFLQDGTFNRVGGTERLRVSTRLITATNRDLSKMCKDGTFRSDLYYRINVIPFYVKPLRERHDDLDALAKYFLTKCNTKYNTMKSFDESSKELMHRYSWPGNVRELEHVIEHAYVMSDSDVITRNDIHLIIDDERDSDSNIIIRDIMSLKEAKLFIEKKLVSRAYEKYQNTYKVAESLNVDQSTVVKLLKKHKLK